MDSQNILLTRVTSIMAAVASGISVLTIVNKLNEETQRQLSDEQNSSLVNVSYFISDNEARLVEALASVPVSTFDEARIIGTIPSEDVLAQTFGVLKSKCKLWIKGCLSESINSQSLILDLKIQGFKNITASVDPGNGEHYIHCEKPAWEVGTSSSIVIAETSAITEKNSSAWKVTLSNLADEDLVDESDLMDDDIVVAAPADCGVDPTGVAGKKRACKNCSCGLAEIEQAAEKAGVVLDTSVPKSSCGSCSKGDAFRCAGCPFLGKPAFEPGMEKVMLSMGADDI